MGSESSWAEFSNIALDPDPRAMDSNPQVYSSIECKSERLFTPDLTKSSFLQWLINSPMTFNDGLDINTRRNSKKHYPRHFKRFEIIQAHILSPS